MSATAQVNERLAALTAAGVSIWLDQIRREHDRDRRAAAHDRRGLAARRHLQPRDLREGDPRLRRTTTSRSSELAARGPRTRRRSTERIVVQRRPAARRRAALRSGTRPTAPTASSRSRSSPTSRTTPRPRCRGRAPTGSLVDRPNLMIKIPGTPEGVPAIEQAIYEGINVNVTLLFGVEAYADVAEAYIRGLERRQDGGQVARRPLGRQLLRLARGHRGRQAPGEARPQDLRAAPAWPTPAPPTSASRRSSRGERFAALRDAGAPVQRPLWASTGVKDPQLPRHDVRRRASSAPDTVNTMPLRDAEAAADHGEVSGGHRRRRTRAEDLEALAEAGIDMDDVTDKLLARASTKFVDADGQAAGRHRVQARGDRHRPPADLRVDAARRARAGDRRAHRRRRASEDVARRVWQQGRRRCGAAPRACRRSPTASAG